VLQNEWQSNILDRLYKIMFKIIVLSQIGADRYQKLISEIPLLSLPWRAVHWGQQQTHFRSDFLQNPYFRHIRIFMPNLHKKA